MLFKSKIFTISFLLGTIGLSFANAAEPLSGSNPEKTSIVRLKSNSVSQTRSIANIVITGNQRIETDTILNSLAFKMGQEVTESELNNSFKTLHKTGYFSDIKISRSGSVVNINVTENPSINRIAYEGNKHVSDKILNTEMQIQPRQLLDKNKIQKEINRINEIYRAKGYFNAIVDSQKIEREQNRVDIVFKITEGHQTEVKKIIFLGNKKFSSDDLKFNLYTKETKWWKFWSSDDVYDPARLEGDQENLRKFYATQGYADFRITSAIAELIPSQKGFIITFNLDEGERYKFGTVIIKNPIPYLKIDAIEKKLKATKGAWYSTDIIDRDQTMISNVAGDHGYAFVNVRVVPERDEKNHVINIIYQLEESSKIFINKINIIGNNRTIDSVIRRQFLVTEGDPYNETKIKNSEQRLDNLGFFKKIQLNRVPVPSDPTLTNIDVELAEKSTGEINFGAGFNSSEGPFGMIGFAERNLFGRAYDLHSRLYYGKRNKSINVSLENPYFLNRELLAGVGAVRGETNQESESSYKNTTTGAQTWVGYYLAESLAQRWEYGIALSKIGSIPAGAAPQIQAQVGSRTASSVTHVISYDKRDHRFNPSEGYLAMVTNEFSGLGGNVKHLKNDVTYTHYYTPLEDLTLSAEAQAGWLQGLGQRPRVLDKYMLGAGTFRGFEESGVSPHYKYGNFDALGGDRMVRLSFEASFPLGLSQDLGIRGAAFIDTGSTWDSRERSPDVYNSKSLRMSAGVGIGWASPLGLIRVDFGLPVIKTKGDRAQIIYVTFGSKRF